VTDLLVLPDVEPLLVNFFRAQPELAELGDRVYTALPARPEWPAARVVRWGGWPVIDHPLVFDEGWCQVDVWGTTKNEVSVLARTMRALADARFVAANQGVVTRCRFGMLHDAPDNTYEPAKPHFRFDIAVLLRPGAPDRSSA
jgi:hypothetical protein